MLSFSDCRIVRALISELLVGTIILLRTSESEADASVRHREVQYDICTNGIYSHFYLRNVHFCSSLFSPDGNTGFVMPERKCVTGCCWRVPTCSRSAGGHHDR